MTILIIEDEVKLAEILEKSLKLEHYSVDTAFDGDSGLDKALKNNYDLIILDIMLPKKDGIDVCKELRSHHVQTPIIMLTARGTVEDRVLGLNIGADDYLVKPFGINELFARIRAVLRRRKTTDEDVLVLRDLVFDRVKHEVMRSGKKIELTPKEYKLLDILLLHKGEAMTRNKLIQAVWGPEFKESGNELNVHIRYLRRKIDLEGLKPIIHTIRGMGFSAKE